MGFIWLALFLAGCLADLLLIHAGRLVGYQHYPPLPRLLHDAHPLLLIVVAVQSLAVIGGIGRARRSIASLLRGFRGPALLLVAIGFLLTSATLSRDPVVYAGELAFAAFLQLVQLGNLALLGMALSERWLVRTGKLFERVFGASGIDVAEPRRPDRWAWPLAAGVTLFTAALALLVYQRHPHLPDEVVYLLHARYFASARLDMPIPPVPDAFQVDLMTYQATRWFSPVPPGWPAILALGAFVRVPWLVDPVLGGINILLAYAFLRELFPRRTARIATALLAVSPWHLFMAMNFMTHTATLTAALAAALAVARLRRDPRPRWALLGGFCLGVVGLIRPLDGLTVAVLLGVWSLGARGKYFRFAPSALLTAATLLTSSLVFPYNRALTGSARVFPLMQYTNATYGPGTNALGFGPNRGLGWPGVDPFPGHGAIDVLVNANLNLFQTNVELLGWATGSLLLLLIWLTSGRLRRPDWLMVSVIVLVAGIHSFYWFSGGPDFGARYWYLIILPCLTLSARGFEYLEGTAEPAAPGAGRRVQAAAVVLVVAAVTLFVPWRAADKYYHYRGMRPEVRRLASDRAIGDGIVLIRGKRFPDYASAVIYNPLDSRAAQPIFTWDRGAQVRRELVQAYPGRAFWVVDGPTITARGYEIVAGPLSGTALLSRADSLAPGP